MASPEHTQLLQLEAELSSDIKEFGACSLNEKSKIQKLNAVIQDKLSRMRMLQRELELLIEELDNPEERDQVVVLLTTHANEYNKIQHALRSAAYQQRQNATTTAAQQRAQLLGAGTEASLRRRQLQNESDLVAASEGVTESLRRTRQMLGAELEHTGSTLAAMEASHAQLGRTRDEYVGQHGLLGRSKGLLRTLDWQNRSETILLWCGLILFLLISAYVVQKRVVYFVPEALRPGTLASKAVSLVYSGKSSSSSVKKEGLPDQQGGGGMPPPMPPKGKKVRKKVASSGPSEKKQATKAVETKGVDATSTGQEGGDDGQGRVQQAKHRPQNKQDEL